MSDRAKREELDRVVDMAESLGNQAQSMVGDAEGDMEQMAGDSSAGDQEVSTARMIGRVAGVASEAALLAGVASTGLMAVGAALSMTGVGAPIGAALFAVGGAIRLGSIAVGVVTKLGPKLLSKVIGRKGTFAATGGFAFLSDGGLGFSEGSNFLGGTSNALVEGAMGVVGATLGGVLVSVVHGPGAGLSHMGSGLRGAGEAAYQASALGEGNGFFRFKAVHEDELTQTFQMSAATEAGGGERRTLVPKGRLGRWWKTLSESGAAVSRVPKAGTSGAKVEGSAVGLVRGVEAVARKSKSAQDAVAKVAGAPKRGMNGLKAALGTARSYALRQAGNVVLAPVKVPLWLAHKAYKNYMPKRIQEWVGTYVRHPAIMTKVYTRRAWDGTMRRTRRLRRAAVSGLAGLAGLGMGVLALVAKAAHAGAQAGMAGGVPEKAMIGRDASKFQESLKGMGGAYALMQQGMKTGGKGYNRIEDMWDRVGKGGEKRMQQMEAAERAAERPRKPRKREKDEGRGM